MSDFRTMCGRFRGTACPVLTPLRAAQAAKIAAVLLDLFATCYTFHCRPCLEKQRRYLSLLPTLQASRQPWMSAYWTCRMCWIPFGRLKPSLAQARALPSLSALAMADLAAATVDAGATAWVLTSTALVFLMTAGLSFFYGGLVRDTNIINTMMLGLIDISPFHV